MRPGPSLPPFHGDAPQRVVVVGGTGTISAPVVEGLVAQGHEVTVFLRGRSRRPLPAGVRVITGDRMDRPAFEATMRREAFDVAYDMISYTPADAESDLRAFDGVRQLIHTSTVCTFGRSPAGRPGDEETPLRPTLPYGVEKVRADEILLEAHSRHGFPVTILKPAHTWGPGLYPIRQLGDDFHWIDRLRAGKPLLIAGSGRELWSICHAEDAAHAYLGLLGMEEAIGETYIVTGPEPMTWLDYHAEIAAALGVRPNLVHAPVDAVLAAWPEVTGWLGGMTRWDQWFGIGKLQAALPSFQPRLTIADRFAKTMAWLQAEGPAAELPDREDEVQAELAALLTAGSPDDLDGVGAEL